MNTQTLPLSGSCRLELITYEGNPHRGVSLDYTEHSPDAWYSDSETSIDLDADKAREIIAFLHKAFPELAPKPLMDAQIYDLAEPYWSFLYGDAQGHERIEFARAIEAAHSIAGA